MGKEFHRLWSALRGGVCPEPPPEKLLHPLEISESSRGNRGAFIPTESAALHPLEISESSRGTASNLEWLAFRTATAPPERVYFGYYAKPSLSAREICPLPAG